MSKASGRKADDSAEKSVFSGRPLTQGEKQAAVGLITGATVGGMAGIAALDISQDKKRRERIDKEARRRNEEIKRKYRGGGGGGLFVTPDSATGRDVTKRFKRN
jgi:hypothetical protein